jgi:hypothetical protein
MMSKHLHNAFLSMLCAAALAGCGGGTDAQREAVQASVREVIVYDAFNRPGGYTLQDYEQKWSTPFGPGEMAASDTRRFAGGKFLVDAVPFKTATDFSVFDHVKYFASSTRSFAVPRKGSLTFSAEIDVRTPGTQPGRVIQGSYGPPGSYPNGAPWSAPAREAQQAAATLHMIDFKTGQLFDWFIAERSAFTLIERLPSSVTGSALPAGRNAIYTQIVDEVAIEPGRHTVAIRLSRGSSGLSVDYLLDGRKVSQVRSVGIPLDAQGVKFTGTYPSLGPGELLADKIDSVVIGHGLFSLLDAFPFQHAEVPELSVSIPVEQRVFGQGAAAKFANFVVTTEVQ